MVRHGCMVLFGVMFPIFNIYTLNYFLMDTQLSVDLG